MSRPRSMMGIASPTGSHLPTLESRVALLPPGALVIEHGAGLYSTVLLSRLGVRVICSEPDPGWAEWARWVYRGSAEIVDTYKRAVERLGDAALVFIDGPARERGKLLEQCFAHRVPAIVMHDTAPKDWSEYGIQPHMFSNQDYVITHDDTGHRTTLWVLRS